jgi:hypothetical protein
MHRRAILSAAGAALSAGLAGCAGEDGATPSPAPAASTLRIRVENEAETLRDVRFQLDVTTPGADTTYLFEFSGVESGATRTVERALAAGTYRLRATLPKGSTTIEWSGRECAEKLVVIRFTAAGEEVISDRCTSEG